MKIVFRNDRSYWVFKTVVERLPDAVYTALHRGIAVATDDLDEAVKEAAPEMGTARKKGQSIAVFDSDRIAKLSQERAYDYVAHQLAGAFLGHCKAGSPLPVTADRALEASAKAATWGFAPWLTAEDFRQGGGMPQNFGEVQF